MKTYAEALANSLKGKSIEIYLADPSRKLKFADFESNQNTIVKGIVLGAESDMLVLECSNGKYTTKVYVNGFQIIGVIESTEGITVDSIFFETVKPRKR